jgi:TRAP-type C4-dicarboxylate transport system substrate-binding protein
VSAKWFDALPKEYQQAVSQAVTEMTAWHDTQFGIEEAAAFADIKQRGMEVNEVANLQAFRDAVKPIYDKYASQVGGWKMIQAVIDTK